MRKLTWAQACRQTGHEQEFISIGCTPVDEDCTQAGENLEDGIIECICLVNQLRRQYGQEPDGYEFFIIENHHEFGIYHEAGIFYPIGEEDYALECEILPEKWDDKAIIELCEAGHSKWQPAKIIKMKVA